MRGEDGCTSVGGPGGVRRPRPKSSALLERLLASLFANLARSEWMIIRSTYLHQCQLAPLPASLPKWRYLLLPHAFRRLLVVDHLQIGRSQNLPRGCRFRKKPWHNFMYATDWVRRHSRLSQLICPRCLKSSMRTASRPQPLLFPTGGACRDYLVPLPHAGFEDSHAAKPAPKSFALCHGQCLSSLTPVFSQDSAMHGLLFSALLQIAALQGYDYHIDGHTVQTVQKQSS